ncbi:hypothetical protein FRC20_011989 [Serendipita sp. 405]|nr:hypothetical protein FRC20_011989 [Serendipita sp. 405]
MESTVDVDLPVPEIRTTGPSALVNSMGEDGNSDYSDPPLFVTSSQCNSPALSSSSFATDQEQLATLSISRFDLLLGSSTAGNNVFRHGAVTPTVKRSISLARHYAEFPLPIVRNLFAICFALEKIQLAERTRSTIPQIYGSAYHSAWIQFRSFTFSLLAPLFPRHKPYGHRRLRVYARKPYAETPGSPILAQY